MRVLRKGHQVTKTVEEHEEHNVKASVHQWTYCSMEWGPGGWEPDWQNELVESIEVDEDTLWCDTCGEKVEA